MLYVSVCMGVTLSLGWLGNPEPRSGGIMYVSNRVRHSNQSRRALGSRRPHSGRVSSNRVRQLFQSVCMGVTLSLGWLGKPEPRSGGAVYVSNHVRHSNMRCWLQRAGCVSQDAYILHTRSSFFNLYVM